MSEDTLELERLDDFKKVLTYHLVAKIKFNFNSNIDLYYNAPKFWGLWRSKKLKYDKKIYKLIINFNSTALSAHQVQSIFGKDHNNKWLAYKSLLCNDSQIKIFNKGSIVINKRRFQLKNRYQLPYEYIKQIFENEDLLKRVLDAGSDYYTNRQRRLIFTQICNKKQNYHYKTKQEIIDEMTDQEKIDALFAEFGDDII